MAPWLVGVMALQAVTGFGTNPGNLAMYRHVPANVAPGAGLVVALHACYQSAADYEHAGWNELADSYGFYVLYPEQKSANNAALCFNWAYDPASPAGLKRGTGENLSIKQMIDRMKTDFAIDPKRVYVTGLSAGGAAAVDLLALWPEVFAAGASIAGIPFRCASSLSDANDCISPGKVMSATSWGDRVRQVNPTYTGTYPRLLVWHGMSDSVVAPANLGELVKQWTQVLGIDAVEDGSQTWGALMQRRFADAAGTTLVESYQVTGMDHGVAIDSKNGCGTAAPFFLDAGICSTRWIASFFGLSTNAATDGGTAPTDGATQMPASDGGMAPPDADAGIADGDGTLGADAAANDAETAAKASGCGAVPGRAPAPAIAWLAVVVLAQLLRRKRVA